MSTAEQFQLLAGDRPSNKEGEFPGKFEGKTDRAPLRESAFNWVKQEQSSWCEMLLKASLAEWRGLSSSNSMFVYLGISDADRGNLESKIQGLQSTL